VGRAVSCVYASDHLSFCTFVFSHDVSKTDATRITKLDIDVVHHESWKTIYFWVKGQGHVVQKNTFMSVFRRNAILTFAAVFKWILRRLHVV